jgi:4-amino-4-deoxy-L-arabinose transferase-like glycosyltransferase
MNWIKKNRFLLLLIGIILVNFLFWGFEFLGSPPASGGDGVRYNEIALNWLNGKGFIFRGEPANMAPGYPAFLSLVYLLFGQNNYVAIRLVQIVLVILSILIIYHISQRIFGEKSATLISLCLAVFYGFTIAAQRFGREVFILFMLTLSLYFLYRTFFSKRKIWFFISGIFLGLLALTNSVTQLLIIFVLPVIYLIDRKKLDFKKIAINCFLILAGFLIIVSSWSVINKTMSGSYSLAPREGNILLMRANYAETLYKDYPAHLIGYTFGYYFAEKIYPEVNVHAMTDRSALFIREDELKAMGFSKIEINSITRDEAIKKILSQPHKYAAMMVLDLVSFNSPFKPQKGELWSNMRIHVMFAEGRRPELSNFVKSGIILTIRFIWLVFFLFMIYGIVKTIKNRKLANISFLLAVIIYFNFIHALIHSRPRYALPIYPIYITFFALGILFFISKFSKVEKLANNFLKLINPNLD